jgi:hypothetical protein
MNAALGTRLVFFPDFFAEDFFAVRFFPADFFFEELFFFVAIASPGDFERGGKRGDAGARLAAR